MNEKEFRDFLLDLQRPGKARIVKGNIRFGENDGMFYQNYTDVTLEEISARMEGIDKISATAAWKIVKRVEERIDKDSSFSKIVKNIGNKMANGEA